MNGAGLRDLLRMLSGRNDTAKQANMVRVVIKRREGKSDYRTAKEMGMAYQTLRGCLVRICEPGPDGLYDRHAPSRARIPDDASCGHILGRASLPPVRFGYGPGSWDPRLPGKIISVEPGICASLRTLGRTLRRRRLSFSKSGPHAAGRPPPGSRGGSGHIRRGRRTRPPGTDMPSRTVMGWPAGRATRPAAAGACWRIVWRR